MESVELSKLARRNTIDVLHHPGRVTVHQRPDDASCVGCHRTGSGTQENLNADRSAAQGRRGTRHKFHEGVAMRLGNRDQGVDFS